MPNQNSHPVLLFDGVCNFCNGTVNLIIRLDRKGKIRFAPLQSEIGQEVLGTFGYSGKELSTIVLISDGKIHTRSDAALQIFKHLGGGWHLLRAFAVIPRPVRNAVYDWIARNRYRWFGKQDACMVPTPEIRSRFLA